MQRIHITPVVLNLIIINVLVFVALNIYPDLLGKYFVLEKPNPFGIHEEFSQAGHTYYLMYEGGETFLGPETGQFKPVQLLLAFFSHIQVWHIAMNMFALISFGVMLEMVMGARRFLIAYLVLGLASSLLTAFFDPSPVGVLGASGGLFGMMVLYAGHFPKTRLNLMFIPIGIPIKGFLMGAAAISAGLIVVEVVTHKSVGNISHFGHLTGMIAGFAYLHLGKLRKVIKK